ncbi:MAG: large-conductance mechanosensitive channel protein MscL [Elusimicrobia bacterium]|jgi:large conductance mechanosensitive channel|nr:large-conductance mechanosensitive channel protein MscL [Elusimicrobiota bacterium]MBK7207544.1 large-conductance mechanosensitive channel protein MscL [Elusimicrobiota bacterium]MBK7544314.1 large-conductance mechanosensitive channel protein MscL [Elusimicrobiota bacterium]MBK7573836.1 large-conductance mechanosensitive channel protein MscL [Elusimicrobiota bacterium]MBK7689434.1 large-conductance mechanosensitive channel protein MscL [Elusimicrobiota bacterium]
MGMIQEFKQFALRGNVVDMAVGVIIGGAFGKIVTSLVGDVLMPVIGILLGGVDFKNLAYTIEEATETAPAVLLRYGVFLSAVVDFLIISFSIFIAIKIANKIARIPIASTAVPK